MPDLIIILGAPASGKTTLAQWVAAEFAWPLLTKDDVKEALFDTLGAPDGAASKRLSEAAFHTVLNVARTLLLRSGVSCVVEGNWSERHTAALRTLLADTASRAAQIICKTDTAVLECRFRSRARHPGHLDASPDLGCSTILPTPKPRNGSYKP